MAENFNTVSGGQGPGGLDRALGNLVAIRQALASPDPQVRIRALKDALQRGEEGAQLLIKALHEDREWEVKVCCLGNTPEIRQCPARAGSKGVPASPTSSWRYSSKV